MWTMWSMATGHMLTDKSEVICSEAGLWSSARVDNFSQTKVWLTTTETKLWLHVININEWSTAKKTKVGQIFGVVGGLNGCYQVGA